MERESDPERTIMRDKVLIVDNNEAERAVFIQMLKDDFDLIEADNGETAMQLIENGCEELAVVLLKLMIPKIDGIKMLEIMNEKKLMEKVPVLIIGAAETPDIASRCFDLGISDFIRRPFEERLVRRRVKNTSHIFMRQAELEEKVQQQTRTMRKQYQLLKLQAEELEKSKMNIIDILGTVVEYRNMESNTHIKRVKSITKILAEELMKNYPEYELTPKKIKVIVSASALHDIGKITIPDHILLKPTKVTEEEAECLKSHTTKGCEILKSIQGVWDEEYAKASYEICRYHHERYDGKGYPDGLAGDEIPISAQLVALADVYDELVSEGIHKKAHSPEQAFHMIVSGECGMFSPKVMDCFHKTRGQVEALFQNDEEAADSAETKK